MIDLITTIFFTFFAIITAAVILIYLEYFSHKKENRHTIINFIDETKPQKRKDK